MNGAQNTLYAVLRDGPKWDEVTLSALDADVGGALVLATVPAALRGQEIDIAGPFPVEASGLAPGPCSDLYVADTANGRVVWKDGVCGARMVLPRHGGAGDAPGQFRQPRALLLGAAGLYVADSGNARVQVFRIPTLEPSAIWSGYFHSPTGLAKDALGRIYVLDGGLGRVLRFSAWGALDTTYSAALAKPPANASATFLAVGDAATLYLPTPAGAVSVIARFDEDGHALPDLPAFGGPLQPGAIAARAGRVFVADTVSGTIRIFDLRSDQWIGAVVGYRGPVAAMAFDDGGALYVKPSPGEIAKSETMPCCNQDADAMPGAGEEFFKLTGGSGCVSSGTLAAGPLDAGEQSGWFRLNVETDQPAGTGVTLEIFVANDPGAKPVWISQDSLDVLLPQYASQYQPQLKNVYPVRNPEPDRIEPQRYLWLRLLAQSADGRATPRILQVQVETPGEDYMDYLPGVFRRKDLIQARPPGQPQDIGFLRRLLGLFRAELGGLEQELDQLPRLFNAATTPAEVLPWLASWLALDPPPGADTETLRGLLVQAIALYRRRGTLFGVPKFIELYSGVKSRIVESFRQRRIWQLGHTSLLGFDTALAAIEPHGVVVPDSAALCESGCDTAEPPNPLVVGSFVVGENGPLAASDFGEPLFGDTAHHFSVFVSAADVPNLASREALRRAVEAERPAHADYDLCVVEPRMRLGLQASLGIDTYVAGPPPPLALAGSILGLDSYLGEEAGERGASRVGQHARLGTETILE